MSETRPHWQDLPFHFKQDVVAYLDFKTRRCLEKCSKDDYTIVKTVPLILGSLMLDLSPDDTESSWYTDPTPGITLTQLLVQERPFSRGLHWRDESEEKTIENLKLIFNNPKVIIKEMIFTIDGNPAKFIEKLLANFGDRKFHVERLMWSSVQVARNKKQLTNCLKFFDLFDAGTLKKLEINFTQKGLIGEMMKMSQFEGLVEEIFIRSEIENEHLENVYHSKRVKVQLEEVKAEDLKKAIEVFQTKSLGSFFKLSTKEIQIDLDKALAIFRSMPNICSVPTEF